ncbi:hypothetical protein [Nocardia alni]|uniref:hypothetical protein n=1 Tax=Nocardia alni TaxID=2815723 RepID=UPI001C246FE1|nr:hypothetical protein [Nocardia alni]
MAIPNPDPSSATAAALTAIRTLVQSQNLRQAKQQLRQLEKGIDDQTWLIITEIAHTLRFKTHDAALGKLRNLWYRNEPYRALIEACVPKQAEGQYIREPARKQRPTQDDVRPRAGNITEQYEDELGKTERNDPGTPRPEPIVDNRDYDIDAVDRGQIGLCVSCRLERSAIDRETGQALTGHGDDGLCGECRGLGRPGIPELPLNHTRQQAVEARLQFLAESFHTDTHTDPRAVFRQEWLFAGYKTRPIIEKWVDTHTEPELLKEQLLVDARSMNGQCAKCKEWRQLRDKLCVDCHPGFGGETTPAGSIVPGHTAEQEKVGIEKLDPSAQGDEPSTESAQGDHVSKSANSQRTEPEWVRSGSAPVSQAVGVEVKRADTRPPAASAEPKPEQRRRMPVRQLTRPTRLR